jgi:hypothetical protein
VALNPTTVWRVRPSGNNNNGGGFDPGVSGVLSTSLSGTLATGGTSLTVVSATGWPSSGNFYARLGAVISGQLYNELVQVTAGQGTTTWTVTRARLGTTNPGITWPVGTTVNNDLSQTNTAAVTGTAGASTASTTFVDATFNAFNSTHVGNVLYLSAGSGATTGRYTIQSVTNATTIVLDRVSGTYTGGTWVIGGAWADPQANMASSGPVVPGNIVYILGTAIPNPASYTYNYTLSSYVVTASGDNSNGPIKLTGDPCTPNFATGGRPCIRIDFLTWYAANYVQGEDIWFVAGGSSNGAVGVIQHGSFKRVTLDQFGYDVSLTGAVGDSGSGLVDSCRVFSSVAKRSSNSQAAVSGQNLGSLIINSNISGCIGAGISMRGMTTVIGCLITKNGGDGVYADEGSAQYGTSIIGCTIDANAGHGINIAATVTASNMRCLNNIISNHTTSGKYPITMGAGTTAQNDRVKIFIDYNTFYNNLNAPNAISYGANDQIGGANPYVDQSNNDYTLTSTYVNTGFPQSKFLGY